MAVWDILLTNPHQGTTFQVLKTAHLVHLDQKTLGHIEGPGPTTLHKDGHDSCPVSQPSRQAGTIRPTIRVFRPFFLVHGCHALNAR